MQNQNDQLTKPSVIANLNDKREPFGIKFTNTNGLTIEVQLANPDDVLELARLYELFLLSHDIPFVSTEKYKGEIDGRNRVYTQRRMPAIREINKAAIGDALNDVKKNVTVAECDELIQSATDALKEPLLPINRKGVQTDGVEKTIKV